MARLCAATALILSGAASQGRGALAAGYGAQVSASVVVIAGATARFTRLVAARDDLYIIDGAAHHVRRYILHGLAYAEQFTQVMRWKEGANGLIMGQPVDLTLVGERLFILDSLGSLWSYWGPDYTRVLVPLRVQSNQGDQVALAFHGAALLLLDPTKRQIWHYAPDALGYDTVPAPLLAHPLGWLAGAVRLATTRAALYVLRSDGSMLALPWSHPGEVMAPRLPWRVTGLWANPMRSRLLVSISNRIAALAPSGAPVWSVTVQGLGGETIRDVALSPAGRLYALTATRVLLLHATPPL